MRIQSAYPMAHIVGESCIRCKYMDCVSVCPVDCFYEGENMLVINPDECIDCGVCVAECPVLAIIPDTQVGIGEWALINREYSQKWPRITQKGIVPKDADEWAKIKEKKLALN